MMVATGGSKALRFVVQGAAGVALSDLPEHIVSGLSLYQWQP